MKFKISGWMILKLGAVLLALATTAVGSAIGSKLVDFERSAIWDYLIDKEPLDTPVVLSPRLQYDPKGILSSRIRIALEKMGIRYRTIDREFPKLPPVVPSDESTALVIEQGNQLLKQHGGDIIVYGSVGSKEDFIFLRLFVQSDCDCLHGATPFDLTAKNWELKLKLMIEAVLTASLEMKYRGQDWIESGMPLSRWMRVWEKKFGDLAKLLENVKLKKQAIILADHAKLTRIKSEGDSAGIRKLKQDMKNKLSKELTFCKNNKEQCEIREKLLFLADLEIYDGLMNGIPELIEEGLSIALLAGKEAMKCEALNNPCVLRPPMQSAFGDWLSMANLILACDDRVAMDRFTVHLRNFLSEDIGRKGFRGGDLERMLWPITFLMRDNLSKNGLEQYYEYLSQHPYFGWPKPDYWQDPFLHAKRSIRRRLQRMDLDGIKQPGSRFLGQQQCPSLSEWMQIKGW